MLICVHYSRFKDGLIMYEFKFIRKNIEQLKEMEKKMNKKS